MKRLVTILCIVALSSFWSGCVDEGPYPRSGRDTHAYFGNARFIILRNSYEDRLMLWDQEENISSAGGINPIEPDVEAYLEKEPYVYCIGEYYTKLEYNEGIWQQEESPYAFSEEDQKIFFLIEQRIDDHYREKRFKKWYLYPKVYD